MSLATRCPACGTTFRVVSDQLKLQRGLVKCGSCGEIFDGIEHMRYISGAAATSTSSAAAAVTPAPAMAASDGDETHSSAATDTDTYELPSFMLSDKKPALATRWLWACLLLLAALMLLAQSAYWYRHEIAAYGEPRFPGLRAWMTRGCQSIPLRIDCTITLPHHIERLQVSAAEVVETPMPGVYSLRLSLRNEGALPQAYPALEMTLSDARNNIVTRRVVLPQEYLVGAPPGSASAALLSSQGLVGHSEQSFIVPLKIESDSTASPPATVAGYLVEIFYP
jgi:predicted Zn finger-like uncharacterized protein